MSQRTGQDADAWHTVSHFAIYTVSTAGVQRTDWQALDTSRVLAVGDFVEQSAQSRWVSVVFMQGDEADEPLRILDELGYVEAMDYLAQWDYGDETTRAALVNGYVYNKPGEGTNDQVVTSGEYALVVNWRIGYVELLRRYTIS